MHKCILLLEFTTISMDDIAVGLSMLDLSKRNFVVGGETAVPFRNKSEKSFSCSNQGPML